MDDKATRPLNLINSSDSVLFDSPSSIYSSPTASHSVECCDAFKTRMKLDYEKRFQQPWSQHPRFYFPDGNVIFLVETTLFKLHRYFFLRDSAIFNSMFSLPPPADDTPEGQTEDKPILLMGVQAKDFASFLSVLYPTDFAFCELTQREEWISVLKVASQWDFSSVRMLAIDKLATILPPVDRIAIGKQYDFQEWLVSAYTELCMREQPLCLQEGEKLGMSDVIDIYRIRSIIRYHAYLNRHVDTISRLVQCEFRLN